MDDIFPIEQIMNDAEDTWRDTVNAASDACQQAITEKRYYWDKPTRRRNGEVVTSPRDIVDTKLLYNSHAIEGDDLVWKADHADINHDGGMVGRRYHLARPWTQHGIKGDETDGGEWQNQDAILDLPEHFDREMQRKIDLLE